MVNFKEIYHFQGSREVQHFQGGEGPIAYSLLETHITCDFPGGGGVRNPCPPLWIRTLSTTYYMFWLRNAIIILFTTHFYLDARIVRPSFRSYSVDFCLICVSSFPAVVCMLCEVPEETE